MNTGAADTRLKRLDGFETGSRSDETELQRPTGEALDEIFAALSDPIRRGIIAQLTHGPASVTQLSMPFDVSAPAISRHLNVLERSGLIERWKQGRVNYCRLVPHPLTNAAGWIEQQKAFWERQFDASGRLSRQGETTMRSTAIADDPNQIGFELQRRFRASPERVFRAWTQPAACANGGVRPVGQPARLRSICESAAPIASR